MAIVPNRFPRQNQLPVAARGGAAVPVMENLEPRQLMSLTPVLPEFPQMSFNSTGVTAYHSGTGVIDVDATPLRYFFNDVDRPTVMIGSPHVEMHATLTGAGALASGVAGDDFKVTGSVDVDGDGIIDATETLLTGEVTQFGYEEDGASDSFEFVFAVTYAAPALAAAYGGKDIGVTLTVENSTFADSFAQDFGGGAKGVIGPVPQQVLEQPEIRIIKGGPVIAHAGDAINYTYSVVNPGTVPLSNVTVLDDAGTPANPADDFYATYTGGDDGNGLLDPGEVWSYAASTTPTFTLAGQLTNTAVASGTAVGQTVTAQDSYTLNPFVLRKALFLYWDSPAYTVPYTVQDTTSFTVEAYKGADLADTFSISTANAQGLWLSDGDWSFQEVNLPAGYLSAYDQVNFTTGQGAYPDWTMPNVVTFDLAVDKSGPETANPGQTITYTYVVTNAGPALVAPVISDDKTGTPVYVEGDTNGDHLIDSTETWLFQANYTVPGTSTSGGSTGGCGYTTYCCPVPNPVGTTITNTVTVDDASNPHAPAGQWILGGDVNLANNVDTWTVKVVAPCPATGKLSGYVYLDKDKDGQKDCGEAGLKNVQITLTGTDTNGNAVTKVTVTDCSGYYQFSSLPAGTYSITETQPAGYDQGINHIGSLGGLLAGDTFSRIVLACGAKGACYNYAEQVHCVPVVCAGQTATIGYWQNCNGQALLKSLNGGPTATNLGNWLAATFKNMFAGLAGKTNAEVAAYYAKLFRDSKCGRNGPTKFDCQVMAVAFAVYATDSSLAGTAAVRYGFKVTAGGVGICTYNIGCNGAAFNAPNYSRMTVLAILQATDSMSANGQIYKGNTCLRTAANAVYTGINETGDIG